MLTRLAGWRRRQADRGDEGFGLAEVVASLLIFALLSIGLLHTLLSIVSLSRDARNRQVAANLAAETIDGARAKDDVFTLLDSTTDVPLNGEHYSVHTTTEWVSDPSVDLVCGGGGGGALRYKRVNVEVTWNHMRGGTEPVRADTIVSPDDRINDPDKGTILVAVLDRNGEGAGGVTVTASPTSGGATPTPVTTDADGCAYLLKVDPGDYTVKISKTNYVDVDQAATPTRAVTVTRSASSRVSFQYDRSAAYTAQLGAGTLPPSTEYAANMAVTFVSTYGSIAKTGGSGANRVFALHPFASGYSAYAGSCDAGDPEAWDPRAEAGLTYKGTRPAVVGLPPGGNGTIGVPLGAVTLPSSMSGRYLRAVSTTGPDGSPACGPPVTLTWGPVTNPARTIALPYGSWELYSGTSAGTTTAAITAGVTVVTYGSFGAGVATLDPRTTQVTP